MDGSISLKEYLTRFTMVKEALDSGDVPLAQSLVNEQIKKKGLLQTQILVTLSTPTSN